MRVFVTGATGFIGLPTVKALIAGGHHVLGLARSDAGASALTAIGASVQPGSLDALDSLRRGAEDSDAVIHLAFVHDWSNFTESCVKDRVAIETIGATIAGTNKALIVTGGLAGLAPAGQIATEDDVIPSDFPFPRVSEQTALGLVEQGVHAAVMRLPQVHNVFRHGLISPLAAIFRARGECVYIGEGSGYWSATHVLDVAELYRLAIENPEIGARYHAIAEEGTTMREIVETLGTRLGLPVRSITREEAPEFFGTFAMFAEFDLRASSEKTRARFGWNPTGPSLIADLAALQFEEG